MIVYTANYGGKDRMHTPRVTRLWNKDLKFVYFTDQPVESKVWDVVVEQKHGDSNRVAKWYKTHSHELFPGEETVWVDASMVVRKDPTRLFQGWDDMLLRTHPERTDIYEEAELCIKYGLGDGEAITKQIKDYKAGGCPKEAGLYSNFVLFRKPSEVTADVNEQWWEQIERWSIRDQISLPYVLWCNGLSFKSVNGFRGTFSVRGGHLFLGSKEL